MTAEKFRALALEFPGSSESGHMGHPDFRVAGKIFATLGYPDVLHTMVKLTPEQQNDFLRIAPNVFSPCNGAWGKRGSTNIYLRSAKVPLVRAALEMACRNVATK